MRVRLRGSYPATQLFRPLSSRVEEDPQILRLNLIPEGSNTARHLKILRAHGACFRHIEILATHNSYC